MKQRKGFSILELVISAAILGLLSVPIWNLLNASSRGIRKVDQVKIARFTMREILSRVESADFVTLYRYFGRNGNANSPTRIAGLGEPGDNPEKNPLMLSAQLFDTMKQKGWSARVDFRFMTKDEIREIPSPGGSDVFASSESGILHLQGGFLELEMSGPEIGSQIVRRPLYCPLILGRPGLMLSQCPALNAGLKRALFSEIL